MISKKIFVLSSLLLLSACGGSSDSNEIELSDKNDTVGIIKSPTTNITDLTGVVANTTTPKTLVFGVVSTNKAVINSAVANAQADIIFPQNTETVEGNVTFLIQATDEDGISEVNLVLSNSDQSITLCPQQCGETFEQTVIGLNPYFYGERTGKVRLEIWLTDNLENQILADAITFNWQPHQIDGVTATRNNQSIDISWQESSALNRYNVYIATEAGVSPENIETLENGQQFLSLSNSILSFTDDFPNKSYQILITGVDGSGESGFSTPFNIAPVDGELNFSPQAELDIFQLNEDDYLQGNVLVNDINLNTGDLFINLDTLILPQHGDLTINTQGTFTYIPTANFNGDDVFSYEVINELGLTDTAIVEITINAVNDPPIAIDDSYSIPLDGKLSATAPGLLANDSDIDLDTIIMDTNPVTGPQRGTLTLYPDGGFEYQGEENMTGNDSFEYRIYDNQGGEDIAEVIIVGGEINTAPIAVNDSYILNEDNTLTVNVSSGLLHNDSDQNNDNFIIDETFLPTPLHGQLLLATNGSFIYIPDSNFYGVDQFQYQIIDAKEATAIATVTLTINSVADTPIAQSDEYYFNNNQILQVSANNGVLFNDINIELGNLHVDSTPVINVQNGTLELNNDGSFSYQPYDDFLGVDSFTYLVSNEQGLTANGQVILQQNIIPETVVDEFIIDENSGGILLDVLANDPNGDNLTITTVNVDLGAVEIIDGQILYTPPSNTNGIAVINYTVSDENGNIGTGIASVTITAVNNVPVAINDTITIYEDDSSLLIDILVNYFDADNDSLTISTISVDVGTAEIIDGKIKYTPPPNTNGIAIISYTISDGNGGTAIGTISITFTYTSTPIALDQTFNVAKNATNGDVIGTISATGIDQQNLIYSFIGGNTNPFNINASSGLLTVNGTTPFESNASDQYIIRVRIAGDDTSSENTDINVIINITDAEP